MNDDDMVLHPADDRATQASPQAPSGLGHAVSIPSAGDLGILEHPYMRDAHTVVRIVQIGRVMWTVEYWGRAFGTRPGEWSKPSRRKVSNWIPLPEGVDPQESSDKLRVMKEQLTADERYARQKYRADIASLGRASSHD